MTVNYFNGMSGVPEAIGPYSQGTTDGEIIFLSGQIPLDPETKTLVSGGIEEQTRQVLKNLQAAVQGVGCGTKDILKATIFLTDLGNFAKVNELYGAWLQDARPARSTVQVAALPLGAEIEIELVLRK